MIRAGLGTGLVVAALLLPRMVSAETTGGDGTPVDRIVFSSPGDRDTFDGPSVTLDVQLVAYGYVENVDLYVDDVFIDTLACSSHCTFEGVHLEEGAHELFADGDWVTNSIDVYVGVDPPPASEPEPETDPDDDLRACACSTDGGSLAQRGPLGLALLILLALTGVRRRE